MHLSAKSVGGLNLGGDKNVNSDKLASRDQPERRWLSYPGGRLCLNPADTNFIIAPTPADLALDLGGYVGTAVVRLPKIACVGLVDAAKPDFAPELAASCRTTWYPYQLEFIGHYAQGVQVKGGDTFLNQADVLVRTLEVKGGKGRALCLTATVDPTAQLNWDEASQSLLVKGSNYFYALRFVELNGPAMKAKAIAAKPVVTRGSWRLLLPLNSGTVRYGIGFGFATAPEGAELAVARAKQAFQQSVKASLGKVKSVMDGFLCKVPAPKNWDLKTVNAFGVTPEKYRQTYYMAWAFLYQSTINVLPENPEFPYPQMSLGKGALWDGGERTSPATCGWESFLGIQWLSFFDPETAWRAYQGIMSRVDGQGRLGGESLPSRKAQTAWVLFQQKADTNRLAEVYPAIKRYLLWREQNPRWIWSGGHDMADEKDLEFVVSWIFDIEYAARIADALGQPDESAFWRSKTQPMMAKLNQWFFGDPKELHQYYFTKTGAYTTGNRNEVRPIMILTALGLPGLSPAMQARLVKVFAENHKPELGGDGFNYLKYPDNDFVAYGLMDYKIPEARAFIEAVVRDCIRGGEFAETIESENGQNLRAGGVMPSLFNPMNLIEFTWLLNGVRYDSGQPVACPLPATQP